MGGCTGPLGPPFSKVSLMSFIGDQGRGAVAGQPDPLPMLGTQENHFKCKGGVPSRRRHGSGFLTLFPERYGCKMGRSSMATSSAACYGVFHRVRRASAWL